MHEATQRRLYRILFIGLAISPMLFVLTVAAYRQSAWRIAGMEKQLNSRLGLKIQITGLTHPLPFHTDVEHVILSDPDTLERVGSIDGLRIQQTNRGLQISAQTVSVDASGQESLWRCVHESLLRSPAIDCCYAVGQIQNLVVFSDVNGQRFEQQLHSVRIEYDRLCDAIGPQVAGSSVAAEHRESKDIGTGDLVGRVSVATFKLIPLRTIPRIVVRDGWKSTERPERCIRLRWCCWIAARRLWRLPRHFQHGNALRGVPVLCPACWNGDWMTCRH
ncbi:MAG: hypothetical protein R3C28_16225 [Pirellulaceae bacterium]